MENMLKNMTPKQIVSELDKYIIGQDKAKRSVAVALRNRYRRIKTRRGHRKAIIAVCRMLLTAIWNVLSKLEPYDPSGFASPKSTPHSKVVSLEEGLRLLKAHGFVVTEISEPVLSG